MQEAVKSALVYDATNRLEVPPGYCQLPPR